MALFTDELQKFSEKLGQVSDNLDRDAADTAMIANLRRGKDCETCLGSEYVRVDVAVDHPQFGRALPCPSCAPNDVAYPGSDGLLPPDRNLSWADIKHAEGSNVRDIMRVISKTLEAGVGGVYIWGSFGLAKTLLLKVAAAEYQRMGGHSTYANFTDMLDDLRAVYDTDHPQFAAIQQMSKWSGVSLLAIDEFDKARMTEFASEYPFRILDKRYETATRMSKGVTLIASNDPPTGLPPSIQSRLSDQRFMQVLEITGRDFRPIAQAVLI